MFLAAGEGARGGDQVMDLGLGLGVGGENNAD